MASNDNSLNTANSLNIKSSEQTIRDFVGLSDCDDYFRFSLTGRSSIQLSLTGLSDNANLRVLNSNGTELFKSANSGSTSEFINETLNPGTYHILVSSPSSAVWGTNYNLGFRAFRTGQANTDVNGDGRDDAIVVNGDKITVRRSDGTRFLANETWTNRDYYGNKGTFFADVNGDGKADAIAVNDNLGVAVRLSQGNKFADQHTSWTNTFFFGNRGTFFADVTGDGRADAIAVNSDKITIRRSDGTKFLANESWTDGEFFGNKGTFFADVNGDGKVDVIAVNDNLRVAVRLSDGAKFGATQFWTDIPFIGSRGNYFADVTGDGKADAIVVNDDKITVRRSDGTKFLPNETWTDRDYYGNKGTFFADVNGDGRADAVAVNDNLPVAVRSSNGSKFADRHQDWTDIPFIGSKGTFVGGTLANLRFTTPVDTSKEWRAGVFSWDGTSQPATSFSEGGWNNYNFLGDINLGSNRRGDGRQGISFNWDGAPNSDKRLPTDQFAIRAYTAADFDGSAYKFRVKGDDGFQIFAKNITTNEWTTITPDISKWEQSYDNYKEFTVNLKPGRYDLHFQFFEKTGAAHFDLSWEKATNKTNTHLVASGSIQPGQILRSITTSWGTKNLSAGAVDAGNNINAVLAAIRAFEAGGRYGGFGGSTPGDSGAGKSIGAYQETYPAKYLPIGNSVMNTSYTVGQFYQGNPFAQDIAAIGRLQGFNLVSKINNADLFDEKQRFDIASSIVNAWGSWFSDADNIHSTPPQKYSYKLAHSQAILEALTT